jgi:hypothetical protein
MQIGGAMASFSSAVAPLLFLPASPSYSHDSSYADDAPVRSAARDLDASSLRVAQLLSVRSAADLQRYYQQGQPSKSGQFVVPGA